MRILLAEDGLVWRRMLEHLLTAEGYDIIPVADGQEALARMSEPDCPAMALINWHMPGLTGLEVIRNIRLRKAEISPYLVLLTARNQPQDIISGLEAGADDYVSKPFHKAELLARLKAGRRVVEAQLQLAESRRMLQWQADHDALTGILNRRAILEHLHAELARSEREGSCIAVALVDLDGLKQINDTAGHQAGDMALVAVVCRIQENLRPYDAIGRLGGDELLIIAPLSDASSAAALFQRICNAVNENPILLSNNPSKLRLTISLGWATHPEARSVGDLLSLADRALYEAKARGRAQPVAACSLSAQHPAACPFIRAS
ncbi:MAG: GGDEF domain-containing response regulator [Bryobacteraceae bacterium]